jgi:hypothetical protein
MFWVLTLLLSLSAFFLLSSYPVLEPLSGNYQVLTWLFLVPEIILLLLLMMWVKIKVKVKLSLCLTKHHTMKEYWGSGGMGPRIL